MTVTMRRAPQITDIDADVAKVVEGPGASMFAIVPCLFFFCLFFFFSFCLFGHGCNCGRRNGKSALVCTPIDSRTARRGTMYDDNNTDGNAASPVA